MGLMLAIDEQRERTMPAKVKQYYDWLAVHYDQATAAFGWQAPDHLWEAAQRFAAPDALVLDCGIGTGQSSEPFAAAGCRCLGLDFSRPMLQQARHKLPAVDLLYADLDAPLWPLADGVFDLAVSAGVFECLRWPENFILRVRQALRRGGRLVFTFDEFLPDHPVQGERLGRADAGIPSPIEDLAGWLIRRHTLDDVRPWLAAAGFVIEDHRRVLADLHFHYDIPIRYQLVTARAR